MNNRFRVNNSLLNFLLLTILASGVTLFLLHKTEEGVAEIDRLVDTPYYKNLRRLNEGDLGVAPRTVRGVYESAVLGISFRYPDAWDAREAGHLISLTDPEWTKRGYMGSPGTVKILSAATREEAIQSAFFVKDGDRYVAIGRFGAKDSPVIEGMIHGNYVLVGKITVAITGETGFVGIAEDHRAFISNGKKHGIIDVIGARSILDDMVQSFQFLP